MAHCIPLGITTFKKGNIKHLFCISLLSKNMVEQLSIEKKLYRILILDALFQIT